MKRIDDATLTFQIRDTLFVFPYVQFIEQFIHDALEYFTYHQQVTNDGMYEDIVTYLEQWQAKLYVTEKKALRIQFRNAFYCLFSTEWYAIFDFSKWVLLINAVIEHDAI